MSDVKVGRGASAKHFHDFRRTAARNMIRGGVPQSIAMRVTGHETDAMFNRYDITDNRDKLAALEAARTFVAQAAGWNISQRREHPAVARD